MAKKHPHPRHIRYPARASATVGYVLLFVSWLLVIGVAGISIVEAVSKYFSPNVPAASNGVLTFLNADLTTGASAPVELALGVRLLLILLLILLGTLSSHFVAIHMSQLLRQLLAAMNLKLTSRHLFVMKCLLAVIAPLLMMVAILGLPNLAMNMTDIIVALCGVLATVSVVCFSIQHVIARRAKMAVKNIL